MAIISWLLNTTKNQSGDEKPMGGFIWSSRISKNPSMNEKKYIDIIDGIMASSPEFNFSSIATQLHSLPEIPYMNRELKDLSGKADKFFKSLDQMKSDFPLETLKVYMILLINRELCYYSEAFRTRVQEGLESAIDNNQIPDQEKIEFGISIWKSLKVFFKGREILEKPLIESLLNQAKESPEYALSVYQNLMEEKQEERAYFFNLFTDDPDKFIEFSKFFPEHPEMLIGAYKRKLWECRKGFGDFHSDENALRKAARSLASLISKRHNLSEKTYEYTLQSVIRDSYPDEDYYEYLIDELYSVESNKPKFDRESPKNLFIININSTNRELKNSTEELFSKWIRQYLESDFDDKNIVGLCWEITKLIDATFHDEYTHVRNRSTRTSRPSALVDLALLEYRSILDHYKIEKPINYFKVLTQGIHRNHNPVNETNELSLTCKSELVENFPNLVEMSFDVALEAFMYLVNGSGSTEGKDNIKEVLDKIYPVIRKADSGRTLLALRDSIKKRRGHGGPKWYPEDYLQNSKTYFDELDLSIQK